MPLVIALHVCAAALLSLYTLHQLALLALYLRACRRKGVTPPAPKTTRELPPVLVQLPFYNERHLARRIIEAAAAFDYPSDRLHIQVLDDSADDTRDTAREAVRAAHAHGVDIEWVHRGDRHGYKAGALAHGLALRPARPGELVAVFDADFTPGPDFLRRMIVERAAFDDPRVGFVQARWDFSNRDESPATRAQAIVLDMHFFVEQTARSSSSLPMAFNGSGGVWRRACIDDAGGWQPDTLTEDLDLSFRAVLRGWRGLYLPEEGAAGELPRDVVAYKRQQARWARGTLQTVRKTLGALLTSSLTLPQRIAGVLHITGYFVHPLILVTSLTTPLLMLQPQHLAAPAAIGLLSIVPVLSMFFSARARGLSFWQFVRDLPAALLLGVGVAFSNTAAMAAALRSRETGEFTRTPKGPPGAYRLRPEWTMWVELALALYAICAMLLLLRAGAWQHAASLLLYALGYGGVWAAQLAAGRSTAAASGSMK